ncbi:MAG: hypothetical protein GXP08_06845 [Gammaproteobacteria bacterium]|nr:hypothetical protein [Gammaproteobacteria bacterium]
MKKIAMMVTMLLVLSGCSLFAIDGANDDSNSTMPAAGNTKLEATIEEAELALKKAASVGGEWRDSKKKYIKGAKSALSKGDVKTALRLANKAKFEAEMGYKQAMEQQKAGPWLF